MRVVSAMIAETSRSSGMSAQVMKRSTDARTAVRSGTQVPGQSSSPPRNSARSCSASSATIASLLAKSLTATIGTIPSALSGLFGGGSFTYTGSRSVGLPLFDGGRNAGNLDYAKASQQVAVSTYERTIQTAFREVADALAQRGTIGEQVSAQGARAEAATVAARLSDARYRATVDSFLTALDAQRTAYSAQQQLVTTRLNRVNNLVALYRSLGGGLRWRANVCLQLDGFGVLFPRNDEERAMLSNERAGDESIVILQTLLCLIREKNLLSRADIEDLCDRVAARAAQAERDPMPCCSEATVAAAQEMARIGSYIGQRYGGKHRRL